jgi:hypothetical protein
MQPMLILLARFGAWRIAWTTVACGVVLIVLIAPAFGASPRVGDDQQRSCAVAGATPMPRATPEVGDEDEDADTDTDVGAAEADDEDCPEATPRATPRVTPHPTPRPTPRHTAKPPTSDDDGDEHESEHDDEGDDD